MRAILRFLPAWAAALALLACPTNQNRGRAGAGLVVVLTDSVRLPGPASGICRDRDELLLCDQSGTNIYRLGLDLKPRPAVALNSRVTGIQGLAADPFFVYVYDERRIYRIDRSSGELAQVASGVNCQSAAIMGDGELAFIDGNGGRVMLLDPTENVSVLNIEVDDFVPGILAAGRDGNLYVLDRTRRRGSVLNRIGQEVRRFAVPEPCAMLAVDDSLRVFLLDRTGARVWQVSPEGRALRADAAELGLNFVASGIALGDDYLFLLDHDSRVLKLRAHTYR